MTNATIAFTELAEKGVDIKMRLAPNSGVHNSNPENAGRGVER